MAENTCCNSFRELISKCCCFSSCLNKSSSPPTANNNNSANYVQRSSENIESAFPSLNISISSLLQRKRAGPLMPRVCQREWKMVEGIYVYEDKTCSICLGEEANIKLECHHFFHKQCLWGWYQNKNSCPNCRRRTNVLDIFCEVCYFEYYSTFLERELKDNAVDEHGLPALRICNSCSKSYKKQPKPMA